MRIFKKNTSLHLEKRNNELISGTEFLSKSAVNSGIKNIFFDDNLAPLLPERLNLSCLKTYSNTDLLWTSIYSLSVIHQRIMCLASDQSFFNFNYLEKYFFNNENLNGGIVLILFKKKNVQNFYSNLKNIFPIYNYYKIDDFSESLSRYFELSERLKLPVLIYLDESALYEFKLGKREAYTERTEKKQSLQLKTKNSYGAGKKLDIGLKQSLRYFKNIGKSFEIFKGKNSDNLVFSDAKNFHKILEDTEFSENSDIILFNLLNPFETDELNDVIKNHCNDYYKNIYIFDDYHILRYPLVKFVKSSKSVLRYEHLRFASEENNCWFCINDFVLSNIEVESTFCIGCNLFTFLHKLKDDKSAAKNFLIGDDECFALVKSSSLKYSFPNLLTIKNPLYFATNLNPRDLNKTLYIFVSFSRFTEQISMFAKTVNNLNSKFKMTIVVYKSVNDTAYNINDIIKNPLLKSIKKVVLKEGIRFQDIKEKYDSFLIFLGNSCENNAKNGRNLNYLKYLYIDNNTCKKFECRLCYQLTKCPAIMIAEDKNVIIDGSICTLCNLCIDICPHNAIKLKKRKRVRIKKSLESKINIK